MVQVVPYGALLVSGFLLVVISRFPLVGNYSDMDQSLLHKGGLLVLAFVLDVQCRQKDQLLLNSYINVKNRAHCKHL